MKIQVNGIEFTHHRPSITYDRVLELADVLPPAKVEFIFPDGLTGQPGQRGEMKVSEPLGVVDGLILTVS